VTRTRPAEPMLHVDMDAFYASVEVLKDPALRGKPVAVGGGGPRGVVMSASYEARRFGISSAMPAARARRLAPQVVFVSPDFTAYRAYSTRLREILLSFTPLVEPISLDEAFLDVGGATSLFGEPAELAARIRAKVRDAMDLVCSIGVAPNKFLAKMASAAAKPDGLLVVQRDGILDFLHPLPVGKLWGVGERTGETLGKLGVRTVGELAAVPARVLERTLGDAAARHLLALASGRDDRSVIPYEAPKSVSHEETFDRDLDAEEDLLRELLRLSFRVAGRLRSEGFQARTITMKARLASFATLTRSRTPGDATDSGHEIYRIAAELLRAIPGGRRRIRLLGVGASGLVASGEEQLALVRAGRWEDAERALDRIERRFGKDAAKPASLIDLRESGETSRPFL
jgi:DNA polymerase IV